MLTVAMKTGGTFSLPLQRVDSSGNPVDISGMTITAGITGTALSDTLDVTKTDAVNGKFTVSRAGANTAAWPASLVNTSTFYMDVKYDDGTNEIYSETILVQATKGIAA